MAIFFAIELIVVGAQSGSPKFFTELSNLSFTVFTFYTVWSALSVALKFLQVHVICKDRFSYEPTDLESSNLHNAPTLYCGLATNELSWYQKVQWLLFTLGAEMAVASTLIYWTLVHKPHTGFTKPAVNVPVNLLNAIVAVVDTWVTGIPIRILHGIYLILFGVAFQLFAGIYYASNGTDINGHHSISHVANFNHNPGVTMIIDIVIPFIIMPAVHMLFFIIYLAREAALYSLKSKCIRRRRTSPQQSKETNVVTEKPSNPFVEQQETELLQH